MKNWVMTHYQDLSNKILRMSWGVWAIFCHTLSLIRNAPWIPWLPQWPRVKVKWPWSGHIWSQEFETGRKKTRTKISNGFLDILKSPGVCLVLEFVKLPKSHCDQWKFGISSKRCISFGQECMEVKSWVFFFNYQEHRQIEMHYKVHLSTFSTVRFFWDQV